MTKQDREYTVVKTVRYTGRVTLPKGLDDEQITDIIYELAESGTWDSIETIESDWEKAFD